MKAFDEIYGLYARRLFAFCLKYTKSKENAEEIMEDTFVWLWNNRSTLEEAESVKPLLLLRAKHYLINAYRKVINSPVYEDYMDYLDHHNNTTADSQLEYDDFVRQHQPDACQAAQDTAGNHPTLQVGDAQQSGDCRETQL